MEHTLKKIVTLVLCVMMLFSVSGLTEGADETESVTVPENAEDVQNMNTVQDNATAEIALGTEFKTNDGNLSIILNDFSTTVNAEKQSYYDCAVSIVMTNESHDVISIQDSVFCNIEGGKKNGSTESYPCMWDGYYYQKTGDPVEEDFKFASYVDAETRWLVEVPVNLVDAARDGKAELFLSLTAFDDTYRLSVMKPEPTPVLENILKTGDDLFFGHDSNGDAINWIVINIEQERATLITKSVLYARQYNEKKGVTRWENCSVRKWLNDDFIKNAFNEAEQALLLTADVPNSVNSKYGIGDNGRDTTDLIYLLSVEQCEAFLPSDTERIAYASPEAIKSGAYVREKDDCVYWWLRTPGGNAGNASYVNWKGKIELNGESCSRKIFGLRPVCTVDARTPFNKA